MHRDQWTDVSTFQQRAPLQEPEGEVCQLQLRRRKPGADMDSGRKPGPKLSGEHPGGDGLCAHLPCARAQDGPSQAADHQGQDFVRTQHPQAGVCFAHLFVQDAQHRNACAER